MKRIFAVGILVGFASGLPGSGQSVAVAGDTSAAVPIVRSSVGMSGPRVFDSEPSAGVSVRSDIADAVQTVSSSVAITEIRVSKGRADVTVHHAENHSTILVDLPNGQVSLVKDGLYTFNAATNTVRVLRGEAQAYRNAGDASKGVKVKEAQEVALFGDAKLKAVNAYRYELNADLLVGGGGGTQAEGYRPREDWYFPGYRPYYAWGYGYPFGYGFGPYGFGLGFGYYGSFGGFRGGGFRGGFRR